MEKCIICLEVKNNPVGLQCGHTFCKLCIDNYVTIGHGTKCPLCRQTFVVDGNAEGQNELASSNDAESVDEGTQYEGSDTGEEVEGIEFMSPFDNFILAVQGTESENMSVHIHVSVNPEEPSNNETDEEEDEDVAAISNETEESSDPQVDTGST